MARSEKVRTEVVCMNTGERLRHVTSIDAEAGIVWRTHQPLRMSILSPDEVSVYPTRFRSIYPIHAGCFRPHLVHCYGRQT